MWKMALFLLYGVFHLTAFANLGSSWFFFFWGGCLKGHKNSFVLTMDFYLPRKVHVIKPCVSLVLGFNFAFCYLQFCFVWEKFRTYLLWIWHILLRFISKMSILFKHPIHLWNRFISLVSVQYTFQAESEVLGNSSEIHI